MRGEKLISFRDDGIGNVSAMAYPLYLHVIGQDCHLIALKLRRCHSNVQQCKIIHVYTDSNWNTLFSQTLNLSRSVRRNYSYRRTPRAEGLAHIGWQAVRIFH